MSEHVIDLDGGSLPLDFANTLSRQTGEHLRGYDDLVAFARQAAIVERAPETAQGVYERAISLRTALSSIFGAVANGETPPDDALAALNRELAEAMAHARVEPSGGGYGWGWIENDDPARLIWPIARAAAELLTDPEQLARVRQCGARDCAWLFMDTSKNRSRQWCDMRTCGNREKARRYLARRRAVTP